MGKDTGRGSFGAPEVKPKAKRKLRIDACAKGEQESTMDRIGRCIGILESYGMDESDALEILIFLASKSIYFQEPEYISERLKKLEEMGFSKAGVGRMLLSDPSCIHSKKAQVLLRKDPSYGE